MRECQVCGGGLSENCIFMLNKQTCDLLGMSNPEICQGCRNSFSENGWFDELREAAL